MKTALTIAGSDCSGGAGIQADLKTMTAHNVYGMSAITALTAQNTLGVSDIYTVTPQFLQNQLDAIFTDIFPDAVKIGMVSGSALIDIISNSLIKYRAKNIVVDPVMVSTSGSKLIDDDAIFSLTDKLFKIATIITPNIMEAEILSNLKIQNKDDMIKVAKIISEKYNVAVLCKGGHSINDANDLLVLNDEYTWFESERVENNNTHGTGCTLSSAIASNLAKGYDIKNAIKLAKKYINNALKANLNLGKGQGPLNHMVDII